MAKDTYRLNGFNTVKVPKLKGRVKITLHNPTTGKNEIIEGSNIVTNAVRDLYLNNVLGAVDYSKTMPLWSNWYGGILAFENAFAVDQQTGEPDPDDYGIPNNNDNTCVAHAGGTVIPTAHDEDLLRGSPTTSAFQYTENSVKQVWEWLPSHGNSNKPISALALTHKDTGDAGTGSPYWVFQNFSPFINIQGTQLGGLSVSAKNTNNVMCQYDESHGMYFHQGTDSEYVIGNVQFASDKLTVHIRKLAFEKAGLYETYTPSTDFQRMFTVELPFTIYCVPGYYWDYANKQLWIFSNLTAIRSYSNTTVNYAVIDCEQESVLSSGTIVSDTSNLAPTCCCNNSGQSRQGSQFDFVQIIKDGNYVYLPTGSVVWGDGPGSGFWDACYAIVNGYKKINISNQAEQYSIAYNSNQNTFRPMMKSGGIIVSSGRVLNGGVGYTCVDQFVPPSLQSISYVGWTFARQDKVSSYVSAKGSGWNGSTQSRYITANKMLLTTKWNLPTPVQKTASQSMAIEYTLTEVDPNEE